LPGALPFWRNAGLAKLWMRNSAIPLRVRAMV